MENLQKHHRLNIILVVPILLLILPAVVLCSDFFIQCTESSLRELNLQSVHRNKSTAAGYAWINSLQLNNLQLGAIKGRCGGYIDIDGQIETDDAITLNKTIEAFGSENLLPVYLNSPGGDVYEALKMGRLLAEIPGCKTSVARNEVCASACVLVFAGGNLKSVADTGRLAIHRVAFGNHSLAAKLKQDEYRKLYDKGMDDIKAYFKEMGIRPELADEMMRYSSDDAHVLNAKEITYYGLDQENPYKYEQNKSYWVARCGQDWWNLQQSLLESMPTKCPINQMSSEEFQKCWRSAMDPLYRMCGLELPKP